MSIESAIIDSKLTSLVKEKVRASSCLRLHGLKGLSSVKEKADVMVGDFRASTKAISEKFTVAPNYEYMTDEEIELACHNQLFTDHVTGYSSIFTETVTNIKDEISRSLQKSAQIIEFEIAALPSKIKSLINGLPLIVDILDNHDIPTYLSPRITPSPITVCA